MRTETEIRDRLAKAYEVLAYYWSYLPEHFPQEYLSPQFRLDAASQAELIVDRAGAEGKHGLQPPRWLVDAARGFNEAITTCVMLEWVLESDSPLAKMGD